MMRKSVAAFFGMVAALLVSSGSVRAQGPVLELSAQDKTNITKFLGPDVVGAALPSAPIADASVYFPLKERAVTYRLTSGKGSGSTHQLQVAKGKRPNGSPAWRFKLTPSVDAYISQTPEGDLVMPALADVDEGLVIITTPANPFVIKGMQPGETRKLSQTVSVNYLDNPAKQDYSGTLNAAYTYVGTYHVTVPAGTYQAILVRLDFEGRIGPATTQATAYYFLAPTVGVVAMISQEDVEAFWIIHIDTTVGKILTAD